MDREDPVEKANPELLAYETPLIFAFPTILAVAKYALFEYDCTPWLAEPLRDLRLLWKIVDFASPYRREGETATPVMPLGTSSFVRFYAVFPHLKTIGKTAKCPIFKKWHDDVINPAFDEALRAASFRFHEEYPPSHKLALLKSETERDEMMRPDVRLTPIKTRVSEVPINTYLQGCY